MPIADAGQCVGRIERTHLGRQQALRKRFNELRCKRSAHLLDVIWGSGIVLAIASWNQGSISSTPRTCPSSTKPPNSSPSFKSNPASHFQEIDKLISES